MKRINFCSLLLFSAFVTALSLTVFTATAPAADAPKGFAFDNPEDYIEHSHFHGGAGTIRYCEYWGPDDYVTNHEFFRIVELPPKSSIGEYRLADSDEVIVILSGHADVTVNGRTGRLVGGTLVPVKLGGSLGVYNPTDEIVKLAWIASDLVKGQYNPVDLGNDLTENKPEDMIPFRNVFLNYWIFEPTGNPSHNGLGSLVETLGIVDFDYFATSCHARFFIIPAGASVGYHTHFTNEEHFFVVSGSGRATVNDVTLELNQYDCKKVGIDDTHGFYNNTDEPLVIFFANLPMPGVKNWGRIENLGDNLADR
jgi:mannose-6-phosphate isomerase-like protein (cupin superfamily)